MTIQKLFLFIPALLSVALHASYAQEKSNIQWGKVAPADFALPASPLIDSNTNAVILGDMGSTHFIGNNKNWFSHVFTRHTRILILNKKAFGLATVKIRLYSNGDDVEKVDNLTASAFNLENGLVREAKVDKNDIFDNKKDKNHSEKKFTLPAVKEGTIIEYSYTITSDFYFNLPSWEFQSEEYPCLWSEYDVEIPQTLSYITIRQGIHTYAVNKGGESHKTYKIGARGGQQGGSITGPDYNERTVSANTIKHDWAMKDIPALRIEKYLSTPRNYIDKLEFQLSRTYNGEDSRDVMTTWKTATEDLLKAEDFGKELDEDNYWLDESLAKVTAGAAGPVEKAKKIYYYVSNHFTCTNYYDRDIKTTLRDVVRKNSGTVGDINLLLIAMLRRQGFSADPVLLSTREYGFNLSQYPVMDMLNYVVARVPILGKIYYLDAARSELGFGQLAGNCYNGHARIISNKDSGSVYFEADSLKEIKSSMIFVGPNDKGQLEGSFQSVLGQQESYNTREKLNRIGEAAFFKEIQTSYGDDLDISNGGIDSLKRPEDPVRIYYDFNLKQDTGSAIIYLDPFLGQGWRENPFKAAERKYPVEMPYAMDDMHVFNMEIPAGYVVDEIPKSARAAFNGDQGFFEYLIGQQGNMIQMRCRLKLNKAFFSPEDYSTLRDFFTLIVKKESEQIVLKKQ